ncbi:hypothetical protein [Actinomadura chibensis]|uniref:Uncharacterized protein n=1 Tax=Actinomadura chibensis TaxID=392828 RepID=A0A5D0NMR0_9ACTN|nr:hypothetical protein [Actinomadura chibensis]TYB45705.1 hypothetical protein FXF69_20045 [Actinomadura chibensis]
MIQWSPVVYGRTHLVDQWRRAWPADVPLDGWAERAMTDVIDGGRGLTRWVGDENRQAPRFLLARGGSGTGGTLVGVACRARLLSDSLYIEQQGERELYCFVGWYGAGRFTGELPPLAELTENFPVWAGAVYKRFMEPVWMLPQGRFGLERTTPEPAPWASPAGKEVRGTLHVERNALVQVPASWADAVWDRAAVTTADFALATGWWKATERLSENLTHVCVEGIERERTVPRPPPPPPPSSGPAPRRPVPPRAAQHQPRRPPREPRRDGFSRDLKGLVGGVADRIGNPFSRGDDAEPREDLGFGGDPAAAQRRAEEAAWLSEEERAGLRDARERYDQALEDAREAHRRAEDARWELNRIQRRLGLAETGAASGLGPGSGSGSEDGRDRSARRAGPPRKPVPRPELPPRRNSADDGDPWGESP